MIVEIIKLQEELKKGEFVKIFTDVPNLTSYVSRTDLLKISNNDVDVLFIYRSNGAKVALDTSHVVMCCVVERL